MPAPVPRPGHRSGRAAAWIRRRRTHLPAQIRRGYKKDVRGVMSLIRQSVKNEELIRRTRADILQNIDDYWVMEIDRALVGCVALHMFPDDAKAELACLYVSKAHENQGYGQK